MAPSLPGDAVSERSGRTSCTFYNTASGPFSTKTEKVREETVYGVTSFTLEQAGPKRLLELVRSHWHIENRSYWVRDVNFGEDHSQVRAGAIPQVMAAIRNLVIGLMR